MKKLKSFWCLALWALCLALIVSCDPSSGEKMIKESTVEVVEAKKEEPPQDWPNLERFQADNEKMALMKLKEKPIILFGNSITEGWPGLSPEFFKEKGYINRGIGGQTTPQMLVRFKQDVVHLSPAAVVILAGINDIAGNTGPSTLKMIMDNLTSMAEIAKSNGIKVLLCSVLPAYDFPWREGMEPAPKVVSLNSMIKQYAEMNGHTYVDYFSAMADDRNGLIQELGYDGVHPNAQGYAVMEPILEKALASLKLSTN